MICDRLINIFFIPGDGDVSKDKANSEKSRPIITDYDPFDPTSEGNQSWRNFY